MYQRNGSLSVQNISAFLQINIFWVFNAVSILSLVFSGIRAGILCSLIIILLVSTRNFRFYLSSYNTLFFGFLITNIISCSFYTFNGRPLSILIASLSYNFVPMLLLYIGQNCVRQGEFEQAAMSALKANVFMMLFGLIPYMFFTDFFFNYIGQSLSTYEYGIYEYRFGSYISSLNLGSVCAASIPLYFYSLNKMNLFRKLSYISIIVISLILCMQRGAWLATFIAAALCIVVVIFKQKTDVGRKISVLILSITVVLLIYGFRYSIFEESQLLYLEKRLNSLSRDSMINSRSYQWIGAMQSFFKYPFGLGMGAAGHKAAPYGLAIVNDGNWLRVLVETGFIGLITFLIINLMAMYKFVKSKNYFFAILILIYCISAIGSNVFDLYYSSFIYWFFLGYVNMPPANSPLDSTANSPIENKVQKPIYQNYNDSIPKFNGMP